MKKRLFLIVLDSFGIGGALDAADFNDEGSDTLAAVYASSKLNVPNLRKLGLYNIEGVQAAPKEAAPTGCFARLQEQSRGKDTTIGHWEIAGINSEKPLPVFPEGFPTALLTEFEKRTGRGVLCNKPYSGTDAIRDYGEEHMRTGALIVYTSADSVFQIAANEAVVPVPELYRYCEMAREILTGDWAMGRVIARPFEGTSAADFKRTPNRHDYSLLPPAPTVLDALQSAGKDVIGVGKIYDIFAGKGVAEQIKTKNNNDGMRVTLELARRDFEGLAFVNLVDFDMVYGHRNDVDGYAQALTDFDVQLGKLLPLLREDDVLMLTADHGCDPATPSTDHSRENVPMLAVGAPLREGVDLGTRLSFGCIANTVAEYFGLPTAYAGKSFSADSDAVYSREIVLELDSIPLTVAFPHLPENTKSISQAEAADVAIDQAVIGSCTNGRMGDMRAAASILKGRQVAEGVRCIVIPATQDVWKQCVAEGLMDIFIDAGAVVSAPTCGPCLGGYMGILAEGERCISTTNRNFVGRMGHVKSEVYLASPAVAAASAIAGRICGPDSIQEGKI